MLTRFYRPAVSLCVVTLLTILSQGCREARFELNKPKKDAPNEVKTEPPKVEAPKPEQKVETPTQTQTPPPTTTPPVDVVDDPLPPDDDFVVKIPKTGYVNQCVLMEASCGLNGMGRITFYYGDRYYEVGNQVQHAYSYIGRYQVTVRCDEYGKQPRFKSQYIDIICPNQ
jgi:hypothetical protein